MNSYIWIQIDDGSAVSRNISDLERVRLRNMAAGHSYELKTYFGDSIFQETN